MNAVFICLGSCATCLAGLPPSGSLRNLPAITTFGNAYTAVLTTLVSKSSPTFSANTAPELPSSVCFIPPYCWTSSKSSYPRSHSANIPCAIFQRMLRHWTNLVLSSLSSLRLMNYAMILASKTASRSVIHCSACAKKVVVASAVNRTVELLVGDVFTSKVHTSERRPVSPASFQFATPCSSLFTDTGFGSPSTFPSANLVTLLILPDRSRISPRCTDS